MSDIVIKVLIMATRGELKPQIRCGWTLESIFAGNDDFGFCSLFHTVSSC